MDAPYETLWHVTTGKNLPQILDEALVPLLGPLTAKAKDEKGPVPTAFIDAIFPA